jgi:hypothetical protein
LPSRSREHGWAEYRAAGLCRHGCDTYSYNNHALRRFRSSRRTLWTERHYRCRPRRHLAEALAQREEFMKSSLRLLLAGAALFSTAAFSQDQAARIAEGKQLYEYWCATCHGPGIGNPGAQYPRQAALRAGTRRCPRPAA